MHIRLHGPAQPGISGKRGLSGECGAFPLSGAGSGGQGLPKGWGLSHPFGNVLFLSFFSFVIGVGYLCSLGCSF